MAKEASKAMHRRYYSGGYLNYFRGIGIDVGCGNNSISEFYTAFPLMTKIVNWEFEPDGDAQYMKGVDDNTFDFLHASHVLEHLVNPYIGLENWIRIIKPNGYIIITIPELHLYEQTQENLFKFNTDHKWGFTIYEENSWCNKHVNVLDLIKYFHNQIELIKLNKIEDFYIPTNKIFDQTQLSNVECAIEIIFRKK